MSLSYTTGNPSNLTAGATANMVDVSGPFADIKTFLADSSGAVNDTILASPNNAVWVPATVTMPCGSVSGLTTTPAFFTTNGITVSSATAGTVQGQWVPPVAGDLAVPSKTTRLRLRVSWLTNATAPAITITWGLYPVTGLLGGAGAIGITMGTVIAGSTAAAVTPGATTAGSSTGSSFDFTAVTGATAYVIGVVGSGSQAASSLIASQPVLEMRHT